MKLGKKEISLIRNFLHDTITPYTIYLFGSYASGSVREDSDLDLAYLSQKQISDYERFKVAQQLASRLNVDVDLVDLEKASTVFQVQIISTGKVIDCKDEMNRQLFEMKTLKMYARLNEEREVILKKISEDGTIYG